MIFQPTQQQQTFIDFDEGSAFVKACPGAGKTQTIVQRLKDQNLLKSKRQGVGVLSFTNSAVKEFKERCAREGVLDVLDFPSFIGTFDSFIWKYIALPAMQSVPDLTPRLMESWGEIYINLRGNKSIQGRGIPLSEYDPQSRTYNLEGVQPYVINTVNQHNDAYVRAAEAKLRILNNKGLYSTSDARKIIAESITNTDFASSLGLALKGRFKEIIIDEAQDCNDVDIDILQWMRDSGIPIIVVCDLGQAIYEFRNAKPEKLHEFSNSHTSLPLSGNFRSTPVICRLAATLRTDSEPDTPLGDFRSLQEPIRILPYSGRSVSSSVGVRFLAEAANIQLSEQDLISLAHDRKSAMRAAGVTPAQNSERTGKRFLVAQIIANFNNSGNCGRTKEKALIAMIRMILEIEGHIEQGHRVSWMEVMQDNDIEEREMRRRALEIISGLPGYCNLTEVSDWLSQVKKRIMQHVCLPSNLTINQLFPASRDWHLPLTNSAQNNQLFNYATVHEAKGAQYPGVLLSIKPQSPVIQQWSEKTISEEVRVLYVGATRAKKLLGIAIPESQLRSISTLLDEFDIQYLTVNE